MDTVVNRELSSLHGGSLEITLPVSLSWQIIQSLTLGNEILQSKYDPRTKETINTLNLNLNSCFFLQCLILESYLFMNYD